MSLVDRVRDRLVSEGGAASPSAISPSALAHAVRTEGVVVADRGVLALVDGLRDELAGAGPLEPLLRLPGVTDVLVNGPDAVYVDCGAGLERMPVAFADEAAIRRLAQRLASQAGRRLDDAHPCVDARLPDGTRLHAVLAPIAIGSTALSLRVPRPQPMGLPDLLAVGAIDEAMAASLEGLVRRRASFLVSGATGSGKTTVLAAMLGLVPAQERIVIVEDSYELRPAHPHCVHLQSRVANIEGAGAVTMRDLVRQSLRMRPDRLVVGEVRGGEVVDLLTALNTGHAGGCGTVHANSAADVPARLEALALAAGIPRDALHALATAGLDAIVHVARDDHGRRRVLGVHPVEGDREGRMRIGPPC